MYPATDPTTAPAGPEDRTRRRAGVDARHGAAPVVAEAFGSLFGRDVALGVVVDRDAGFDQRGRDRRGDIGLREGRQPRLVRGVSNHDSGRGSRPAPNAGACRVDGNVPRCLPPIDLPSSVFGCIADNGDHSPEHRAGRRARRGGSDGFPPHGAGFLQSDERLG